MNGQCAKPITEGCAKFKMETEGKFGRNPLKDVNRDTMDSMEPAKRVEGQKKKKVKLGSKLTARLQRSRLNRSKGSMNVSFNTSRIRQTLKANNKQLARALAESRATINTLQKQNLELQSNNQRLVTEFNTLRHVSGLSENEVEQEVETRFQERMNWLSDILNKMSTQFVSLVETFTELNYTSKFKARASSCGPEQQLQSRPAQPIKSSNILEKVLKASTDSKHKNLRHSTPEEHPGDVKLSPAEEHGPCSSNPDLSVILEQTNIFENSILATISEDRHSKGEKYSREYRRTAMTDFSTLKEFQSNEDNEEESMEVSSGNQCTESAQSEDFFQAVSPNTDNGHTTDRLCDLRDDSGTENSEKGITLSVKPDLPALVSETSEPSSRPSRKSVRKSRKVRDADQVSPEKVSLSSETEDLPLSQAGEGDSDVVFAETKSQDCSSSNKPEPTKNELVNSKDNVAVNSRADKQVSNRNSRSRRGTFAVEEASSNGRVLRRETLVLDKAPTDQASSSPVKSVNPEKAISSKTDRRGTFVVPPPVKEPAEPHKPSTGRKRRSTYRVEEPDEGAGIMQQSSDVLITEDVLDQIESIDCDTQHETSPPRSSIATSGGDVTVNEVLDMELTAAIDGTIIKEGDMNQSDQKKNAAKKNASERTKPLSVKSKTSSSKSKPREKDKTVKDAVKKTETMSSDDNDRGKGVFKAWLSKPGNITFTSGRKDLASLAKEGTQKSRSKQKSMLPKKPRSKTGRSKPRLLPDMSPKTVFDFSGTPRNAVATGKSVYDMSLNESVTATKQTYQEFKEKPVADDKVSQSRPNLKMVKERFAKEAIEEATISPHGIMLVLGDGKRTKPRSKKQVSYSGKLAQTHLTTPQVSNSPGFTEDASKTPPGRSSRRASEASVADSAITDDAIANDAIACDAIADDAADDVIPTDDVISTDMPQTLTSDETVQDAVASEAEGTGSKDNPKETSVYEENVKIMPDIAATPTPLKRLKGRKFTSTEEEMKALFESSLMTTPVDQQKATEPRHAQQPKKIIDEPSLSVCRASSSVSDTEKPKKLQHSDSRSQEINSEPVANLKEHQSPSHRKPSAVNHTDLVAEQGQDLAKAFDENDCVEESPKPSKPTKKKPGKSVKKSRSRAAEAPPPHRVSEPKVQTPDDKATDNATSQLTKRKRGSSQIGDAAKEKQVSPKSNRSQKSDEHVFAVPVGSPPKRPRRGAVVTSYKEPSLNCKMRKGDKAGTIFVNNVEVKTLVGSIDNEGIERKKSTDKRTVLKDIVNE